jgi:hypothetical protein
MTVRSLDLIRAFEHGDFAYLADLVRNNTELTPEVRQRLADLLLNMLSGKWRRAAKRPRAADRLDKMEAIAANVQGLESEGWKKMAAIEETAELFGCSPRWVNSELKRYSELHAGDGNGRVRTERTSLETVDRLNWLAFVTCFDDPEDDWWMHEVN